MSDREEKLRYEKAATEMAKHGRASCTANSSEEVKSHLHRALNNHAIHDAASPFLYFLGSAYRANISPSPVEVREYLLKLFRPKYAPSALVQKPKNLSILENPQSEKPYQYPPIIKPPEEDDTSLSGSSTAVDQSSLESDHSSPSNLLRQPPGHLDWAYWVRIPASNEFFICEIGYHVFISWYDDMTPYLSVVMDDLEDSTTSDEQRADYVLFKIVVEGVVRLYNRYVLWENMIREEEATQRREDPTLKAKGRQIRREDELLHFALAVRGKVFQLYVFQPIINESRWSGCRVQILAEGDLTIQHHTEQLINDIDKVHKWADALYTESIWSNLRRLCPGARRANTGSGV